MANLDLAAILTGATADQKLVLAAIIKLEALMADTHLSDEAHAQIKITLDEYATWRHVIEGLIGRITAYQALGYPEFPAGDLLDTLKDQILKQLQAEEDMINAEQEAIEELFEETHTVNGGSIDFKPAIEKR